MLPSRPDLEAVSKNLKKPAEKALSTGSIDLESAQLRQRFLTKMNLGLSQIQTEFPNIRFSQLKGLQDFIKYLEEDKGPVQGWFRQPTGAGKTVFFAWLIRLLNEDTVILVPNNHLLKQTQKEFLDCGIAASDIGLMGGGYATGRKKFTITTYQSYLRNHADYKDVSLVVCDEAHKSVGERTREAVFGALEQEFKPEDDEMDISDEEEAAEDEVMQQLSSSQKGDMGILGFTATPVMGRKNVADYFGKCISEVSLGELIKAGFLKKVFSLHTEGEIDADMDGDNLTKEKEGEVLRKAKSFEKLLELYSKFKEEHPETMLRTGVFCNSIEACKDFLALAEAQGYKGMIVTGTLGSKDLETAEAKLLAGEINMIITVDKLKEGWNFPALNSVIWARAVSSPASFIQGVGRALRAYMNETIAYLFETEWYRKGSEGNGDGQKTGKKGEKGEAESNGGKRTLSRKALSFAQALILMGEDPFEVLGNEAEDIRFNHFVTLINGEGTYMVGEGIEVIGVRGYSEKIGIHKATLSMWIEQEGVMPLKGIQGRSGPKTVDVYRKSDIDALVVKKRGNKPITLIKGVGTVERREGIIEVVSLQAYAEAKTLTPAVLKMWVERAGLTPISDSKGVMAGQVVTLYSKQEVDGLILEKRGKDTLVNIDKGLGVYEHEGVTIEVVGVSGYAKANSMSELALEEWLTKAGIKPIEGVKGLSGKHPVDLYRKADVEAVIRTKRGTSKRVDLTNGIGQIMEATGEAIKVVALNSYAGGKGIDGATLRKWVWAEGIKKVDGVEWFAGGIRVAVYRQTEVDTLIEKKRGTQKKVLLTAGIGVYTDELGTEIVVVGLRGYAKKIRMSDATLKLWAEEMGLTPLEDVKGDVSPRLVDVYRKTDIDAMIELKQGQGPRVELKDGLGRYTPSEGDELEVVGLAGYAKRNGIPNVRLEVWAMYAGLRPIVGTIGKAGGQIVDLYLRADVDRAIEENRKRGLIPLEKGLGLLEQESGQTMEVVGLSGYGSANGVDQWTLEELVRKAGVQPLEGKQGSAGNQVVALYRRADIDPIIKAKLKEREKFVALENGVGIASLPNAEEIIVIGVTAYARRLGIDRESFVSWLGKAGIHPIKGIKGKASKVIDLYDKEAVDAMLRGRGRLS